MLGITIKLLRREGADDALIRDLSAVYALLGDAATIIDDYVKDTADSGFCRADRDIDYAQILNGMSGADFDKFEPDRYFTALPIAELLVDIAVYRDNR